MKGKCLLLALVLVMSLSVMGCSLAPDAEVEGSDVTETTMPAETPAPQATSATPQPTPTAETPATPEASVTPVAETLPTPDSSTYSTVEVPEAGLTFEMPEPWVRLEPGWIWAPEAGSELQVGMKWQVPEPPQEVEAAMLPTPSEVVSAEPVELDLGTAQRFLLNVFGPTAEGSGEQAPVDSVQTHVLMVVEQAGTRLAYDFFASGADAEQLEQAESVLEHLVASVRAQGMDTASLGAPTPGVGALDADAPEAVAGAIAFLAQDLAVAEDTIELVDWEYVDWSDACLGIHTAGMMCAQVITPGYRITLTVGGKAFELHTNQSGSFARIALNLLP